MIVAGVGLARIMLGGSRHRSTVALGEHMTRHAMPHAIPMVLTTTDLVDDSAAASQTVG